MAFAASSNFTFPTQEIRLDNVTLDVQVADTQARMEQGLQFSDPLPYNQGMLFVPPSSEVLPMWMPNMKFSLDMMWFDDNGNVIHIEKIVSMSRDTAAIISDLKTLRIIYKTTYEGHL